MGMNSSEIIAAFLFMHISQIEIKDTDLLKMKIYREENANKHRKTYYWTLNNPPHSQIMYSVTKIYRPCFKITIELIEQTDNTINKKNIYKCTELIATEPNVPYLIGPKIYID